MTVLGFDRIARRQQRVVYERHFDAVRRTLRRLGLRDASLDDAVQDVFVIAFERRHTFAGRAQWRAWLLGIARRVASHAHRDGRRWAVREGGSAATLPAPGASAPDETLDRRDTMRRIDAVLERLKQPLREVFVLCELEGLTAAEAARALDVSPNTLASRRRAARRSFARELRLAAGPVLQRGAELEALLDRVRIDPAPEDRSARDRIWLGLVGATRPWAAPLALCAWTAVVASIAVVGWVGQAPSARPASIAVAPRVPAAAPVSDRPTPSDATPTPVLPPAEEPAPPQPEVVRPSAPRRNEGLGSPSDKLREEARLLSEAKARFDEGSLEEAQRRIDRHAQNFPDGALARERARIQAMVHAARER